MKLLTTYSQPAKTVSWHGHNLVVPVNTIWVAADCNGLVCAFSSPATPHEQTQSWLSNSVDFEIVAKVEFNGTNWRSTGVSYET